MKTPILAVANLKGGSCKTTTAVTLAAAWAERGHRVLLVDLDAQASATEWIGEEVGGSLKDALISKKPGPLAELARPSTMDGVDLVSAAAELEEVEAEVAKRPHTAAPAIELLRRSLDASDLSAWDAVVFDCPPALGILTSCALAAATHVLAPVEASAMGLQGVENLADVLDEVRENFNADVTLAAVLVCRVNPRTNLGKDVLGHLQERFGDALLDATIRETVRVKEAPAWACSILKHDPHGTATTDYRDAAREVAARINLAHTSR